ncbi:endonuclease/exonuclease/phosphatase family protein [Geodermatophilus sp. SYSU D00815]
MRILQLNVWARSGPYEVRSRLLRAGIGLLAPDLVSLQEVDAGPGEGNQAAELLGPLGYEVVYERRDGEYRGDPGVAVATRHPVLARHVLELPHGGVALAVRVAVGRAEFWFCSATTSHGWPHQEALREDVAVALDAGLAELAAGDEYPPVIGGDFDATPEHASIRFLTGKQSLQGRSTSWADAFAVAGEGPPHTWSTDNPYVAPFAAAVFAEPEHHRRIDYVLVGSPFTWRPRVAIRSARVVLRGDAHAAPSDHWGVLADLELDGIALGGGRGLETWEETARLLWPDRP